MNNGILNSTVIFYYRIEKTVARAIIWIGQLLNYVRNREYDKFIMARSQFI